MRNFSFTLNIPGMTRMEFSGVSAIFMLALIGIIAFVLVKLVLGTVIGTLLSPHILLLFLLIAAVGYLIYRSGGLGNFLDRFR